MHDAYKKLVSKVKAVAQEKSSKAEMLEELRSKAQEHSRYLSYIPMAVSLMNASLFCSGWLIRHTQTVLKTKSTLWIWTVDVMLVQ